MQRKTVKSKTEVSPSPEEFLSWIIVIYFCPRFANQSAEYMYVNTTGMESALARSLFRYRQQSAA